MKFITYFEFYIAFTFALWMDQSLLYSSRFRVSLGLADSRCVQSNDFFLSLCLKGYCASSLRLEQLVLVNLVSSLPIVGLLSLFTLGCSSTVFLNLVRRIWGVGNSADPLVLDAVDLSLREYFKWFGSHWNRSRLNCNIAFVTEAGKRLSHYLTSLFPFYYL